MGREWGSAGGAASEGAQRAREGAGQAWGAGEGRPPTAPGPAGPAMPPLPERQPARTVAQQIAAGDPVSEYAKQRPAPQGLDVHGRPAPVAPAPQGDDHLDIPAFLRRQAN